MEFLTKSNISLSRKSENGLMGPLTKLFECSICTSLFKAPMELKCGHIFCKECLKKGMKNRSDVLCPTCTCKTVRRALQERNDILELTSTISNLLKSFSDENKRRENEKSDDTPLDLSLKNKPKLCSRNPIKTGSAIKFIKPLDLTCGTYNPVKGFYTGKRLLSMAGVIEENQNHQTKVAKTDNPTDEKSSVIELKYQNTKENYNLAVNKAKKFYLSRNPNLTDGLRDNKAKDLSVNNPNFNKIYNSTKEKDEQLDIIGKTDDQLSCLTKANEKTNDENKIGCPATEEAEEIGLINQVADRMGSIVAGETMEMDFIHQNINRIENQTIEKVKEVEFKNRNVNQTEETYYSETNFENENIASSDSEVSVLAETPVKETDLKRKSLREIYSTLPRVDSDVKESVSSVESEATVLPQSPSSKAGYVNRQNEYSEIPSGMFEMSFDKLEEIQQMRGQSASKSPPEIVAPKASSSIPSPLLPTVPKKFVFCPTRLSKPQLLQLQKLCDICNGSIVKIYNDDVTHLVINLERGRVPQTVKYLFAIAGKKWVVTFAWVYKCLQEGQMVDEQPFETSSFPECDVGVKKSRIATSPLFKDFNFFIMSDMKSSGATVDECKKLLTQLGGNIIVSPGEVSENVMIIGDLLDRTRTCEYWYKMKGWLTVSWEWILDCILTFSLANFSKHHLITDLNGTGLSKASLPKPLVNVRQV